MLFQATHAQMTPRKESCGLPSTLANQLGERTRDSTTRYTNPPCTSHYRARPIACRTAIHMGLCMAWTMWIPPYTPNQNLSARAMTKSGSRAGAA